MIILRGGDTHICHLCLFNKIKLHYTQQLSLKLKLELNTYCFEKNIF